MRVEPFVCVRARNCNWFNKCKHVEENPLPWTYSRNYLVIYVLQIQSLFKNMYLKRYKQLERRSFQAFTTGLIQTIAFYVTTMCRISFSDVSDRPVASVFGVNEFGSVGLFSDWKGKVFGYFKILATFLHSRNIPPFQTLQHSPTLDSITVKMEAALSSETSEQTHYHTVCKNSEDHRFIL